MQATTFNELLNSLTVVDVLVDEEGGVVVNMSVKVSQRTELVFALLLEVVIERFVGEIIGVGVGVGVDSDIFTKFDMVVVIIPAIVLEVFVTL